MRRIELIVSVALLGVLAATIVGFAVSRRSAEKWTASRSNVMTVNQGPIPLTVQDFPAHGIIMRHMADARYRQEAEYIFQTPAELREVTNRYSFVIENTSNKAIIALSIASVCFKPGQPDPQVGTIRSNSIQARLMGATNSSLLLPGGKVGFCLALGQENLDFKNGIRYIQPERPMHQGETIEFRQKRNQAIRSRFVNLENLLRQSEKWVVEVEGAIFEDGTFVGTNRRFFFEQMNSKVEGARSLAIELAGRAEKGEPFTSLVVFAQKYAESSLDEMLKPFGGSLPDATRDEAFNAQFAKNLVANRFIHLPEQNALNFVRHGAKHWIKLTR